MREIPLYFYVPIFPWKRFFDGTDQENSKTLLMGQIRKIQKHKEERDRSGKFEKTRRKERRKEKEEIVAYMEVPILMCSPSVEKHPHATLPPSGECTHVGTSTITTFNA